MNKDLLILLGLGGVAAYFLLGNKTAPAAVAASGASATTGGTSVVATQTAPPSPPASTPGTVPPNPGGGIPTFGLSQIAANIQAASVGDPAVVGGSATPYVWNFYLQQSSVSGGKVTSSNVPDASVVFPNVDLSQPMPFATYWAAMSPYLAAHYGLSGLGFIPRSPYFDMRRGGWRV